MVASSPTFVRPLLLDLFLGLLSLCRGADSLCGNPWFSSSGTFSTGAIGSASSRTTMGTGKGSVANNFTTFQRQHSQSLLVSTFDVFAALSPVLAPEDPATLIESQSYERFRVAHGISAAFCRLMSSEGYNCSWCAEDDKAFTLQLWTPRTANSSSASDILALCFKVIPRTGAQ